MNPGPMAKQSDLNPLKKYKIPTKYKHMFFNQRETTTHLLRTEMLANSCFEIM